VGGFVWLAWKIFGGELVRHREPEPERRLGGIFFLVLFF